MPQASQVAQVATIHVIDVHPARTARNNLVDYFRNLTLRECVVTRGDSPFDTVVLEMLLRSGEPARVLPPADSISGVERGEVEPGKSMSDLDLYYRFVGREHNGFTIVTLTVEAVMLSLHLTRIPREDDSGSNAIIQMNPKGFFRLDGAGLTIRP